MARRTASGWFTSILVFDNTELKRAEGECERMLGEMECPAAALDAANEDLPSPRGGRVWNEGEVDRGATFYFALS